MSIRHPITNQSSSEMREEQTLSFWQLSLLLWKHKWVIVSSIFGCLAIAGLIAFTFTPIYRASVLAAPVTDTGQTGLAGLVGQFSGLAGLAGISPGAGGSPMETIAQLQSQQFISDFIKNENLLPILFADEWDAEGDRWRSEKEVPTLEDAYRLFIEEVLQVDRDRDSGLVTVSIEWSDPQLAAKWANSLVAILNEETRKKAIQEATTNLDYLKQQLANNPVNEVQTAIYKLIENQMNAIVVATGRSQYAVKVLGAAISPDADHFVRPKRVLMIVFGGIAGLMIGVFVAILFERLRPA